MGLRTSRRVKALLGLMAAALSAGCPPVNPPPGGNPNEAGDRAAIASLLDAQEAAPFFQSRLINDGVGIFSMESEVLPSGMPRRWGRSYAFAVQNEAPTVSKRSVVEFNKPMEAVVLYKQSVGGKLVLDYTWQRKLLSKPFVETSLRTARFRKSSDGWRLTDVNVARIHPEASGFKAGAITLSLEGEPVQRLRQDDWISLEDMPRGRAERWGRLEMELSLSGESADPAFYAFLSVPPMRDRVRLRDDGQGADRKARDGVYSAEFMLPSEPGIRHLVIDAIASKTFADPAMTNYEATQWGIPYRVEGGEAR